MRNDGSRLPTLLFILCACGLGVGSDQVRAAASLSAMRPATYGNTRGYLFTKFTLVLPGNDQAVDCPDGFSLDLRASALALLPPDKRPDIGEKDMGGTEKLIMRPGDTYKGHNVCSSPAEYSATGFHTVDHDRPLGGLSLDGTANGTATANSCAHKKFASSLGGAGIDNQVGRALGCVSGFRPGGVIEVSSGRLSEWGVLMEVSTSATNSNDVEVRLYASDDTPTLGADGQVLPGLSLQPKKDPKYVTIMRGRIVDGVLTTDPVDFRYRVDIQVIHEDPEIRGARLRLEFLPDGRLKGVLAGYFDVEKFYQTQIRAMTLGGSIATGTNCPGVYAAFHNLADGYPDGKTGECTALSGALAVEAIPAFVVYPEMATTGGADDAKPVEETLARIAGWIRSRLQ